MIFDRIRVGSRVTILVPNGLVWDRETGKVTPEYRERTGRAVMKSTNLNHWVLNMGGQHGTPAVATPDNVVAVGSRRN